MVRQKLEGIGILMPDLNIDGRAGWRWHFWQGLWYRWLVDREREARGRFLAAKDAKSAKGVVEGRGNWEVVRKDEKD